MLTLVANSLLATCFLVNAEIRQCMGPNCEPDV